MCTQMTFSIGKQVGSPLSLYFSTRFFLQQIVKKCVAHVLLFSFFRFVLMANEDSSQTETKFVVKYYYNILLKM